eukprot:CAMPEP_0174716812 /NCGR_PEP_ID=MMETSP1094-20130205/24843_1 /TAXON_ID=156173 /ORGANISM="Chrysochromulina brevifilum, Strain UTEX LB 985" /LENGTH=55 /DNA_ID=CAMNT_0015916647 /DNA_START=222 /DNA_END=386 /DNA_ORIENTATION=+
MNISLAVPAGEEVATGATVMHSNNAKPLAMRDLANRPYPSVQLWSAAIKGGQPLR